MANLEDYKPTIDEAMEHLGIDYGDEVILANVTRALTDAKSYLQSAVGADVFDRMPNDPKVSRLVLSYMSDFYDERGTSAKAGNAKREMIHSMEWQLKLELARLREEEAGA